MALLTKKGKSLLGILSGFQKVADDLSTFIDTVGERREEIAKEVEVLEQEEDKLGDESAQASSALDKIQNIIGSSATK